MSNQEVELELALQRFQEIGIKIAALSDESKQLREDIADLTEQCGLGKVGTEEFTEYLTADLLVQIKRIPKPGSDVTVLFRKLRSLGG